MLIASSINVRCSVHSFALLALALVLLHSTAALSATSPNPQSRRSGHLRRADGAPAVGSGTARTVSAVYDIDYSKRLVNPSFPDQVVFKVHSFLQFSGTPTEGPFRVEVALKDPASGSFNAVIRGVDDGTVTAGDGIGIQGRGGMDRAIVRLGETALTNRELINPETGKGLVMDTWMKDPVFRYGGNKYSGVHDFTERMAKSVLGKEFPMRDAPGSALSGGKQYAAFDGDAFTQRIRTVFLEKQTYDQALKPLGTLRSSFTAMTSSVVIKNFLARDVPVGDLYVPSRARPMISIADMIPIRPSRLDVFPRAGAGDAAAQAAEVAKGGAPPGPPPPARPLTPPQAPTPPGSPPRPGTPGPREGSAAVPEPVSPVAVAPGSPAALPGDDARSRTSTDSFHSAKSAQEIEAEVARSGRLPADGGVDSAALARAVQSANEQTSDAPPPNGGAPGRPPPPGPGAAAAAADDVVRVPAAEAQAVSLVRTGGTLSRITTVGLSVAMTTLKVVGTIALIAAPIFIIMDLVKGDYVGAAIGIVGLGVGLGTSYAIGLAIEAGLISAGPVGWIIGGIVAALFAILPFLFKKRKKKPKRDNPTQVIQWILFGDKDHTGNEKCQEKGNKDCQALYGPGIVAHAFGWNNFEGFAFLINYNKGFAMTIPEMAAAFKVLDPDNRSATVNETAVIDCQNDDDECGKPKFIIRLDKITIPNIDQTADKVAQRIIPQPGGDCKLVADPINGQHYPAYNITITGQPATVACGIVESLNINGKAVAAEDSLAAPTLDNALAHAVLNNATADGRPAPMLANSPDLDSSGNSGDAFIAAPAMRPFKELGPMDGMACVGFNSPRNMGAKPADEFCLANGTYRLENNDWNFDLRDADALRLPPGGAFKWGKHDDVRDNQTLAGNPRFQKDVHQYNPKKDNTWVNISSIVPDVVCLYAKEEYEGNAQCFGEGGAMLPDSVRKKAKSVQVHGDAVAWIYADHYGDEGGAQISTNVPDLSSVGYGLSGNFSEAIVAMWISASVKTPQIAQQKVRRRRGKRERERDLPVLQYD